ncbi:MAG: hypothetical protein U1A72_13715 [Sulfuritalea sp.]|nr:hypothetical protein [Sulfuritalea sp.]
MQPFRLTFALLLFVFVMPGSAWAQEQKVSVAVVHSGDDIIGKRLAFALREAIRSSSGYKLADESTSLLRINLTTIDPALSPQSGGAWTAASVVFLMTNIIPLQKGNPQTWYPIYLTSLVLTAGSQRVEEQAKGILASLDNSVEQYKQSMKQQ